MPIILLLAGKKVGSLELQFFSDTYAVLPDQALF